ncbi:hypothetical protein [Olleya sp. R77988]|uniref:hypothetical protein n=1 Tax=Olleya sp. R77988 TaxID=3093875 RepID=UPI0037C896B0
MKKLLLPLALVLLFSFKVSAQDDNKGLEGAWWALGQLEYNDSEATDTSTFGILPVVGTFISPSVTVGLGVGYSSTTVGEADAVDAITIMPLVRKYWSINDQFYIFGQADVPVQIYDGATGYGFNLRPGIDFFVSDVLTLEATFGQFGYNAISPDEGDAVGTTSLGFNSMNVNFGIKLLF